ncbi:LysM peptidoglycan-binding domain-containing protein [Anaerobacillus sp. CMMVII]|uniref:LysM peptidoglycan-binding domain-containing protein n=1 Tax=Anaerobacillus sp. CMMVII TaxID=2755588 RepID=UPI0021B7D87D|nr:LysM peptidoglycan-binding domain-containing protein [Anaerobacillus sp. CMMVII]MCT8138660.1 LysM peptidoglycan-binding domain-containing protein [Anaerobacillus sp. CMMVII]
MTYSFQKLPQLIDQRGLLPSRGSYTRRNTSLKNCVRAWHHSLTRKHLPGSNALGFANYHVNTLGWPGPAYALIIEPQNIVNTPQGKRARIVYANDISLRTYHVGNSNDFAIGICVAGDYRTDELDEATKVTIAELQAALVKDGIGNEDKSHHEFSGYSWKQCCVFDYNKTFTFLAHTPVTDIPDVYTVQQGDTLWGIANGDERFTVEDLIKWNDIKDPSRLQVGQKLHFKVPAETASKKASPKVLWVGTVKVAAINVRKGPSVAHPAASQLKKGDEVTVYKEHQNGWLDIGNGQFVSNVKGAYVDKKQSKHPLAGRRVEAIAVAVNFYDTPRWDRPSGQFTRGQGWIVIEQVTTNGSPQYKVKNSRGNIYYITSRKDLVRLL